MEKEITKVFSASTLDGYNALLAAIAYNNYACDIEGARTKLSVSVTCRADQADIFDEICRNMVIHEIAVSDPESLSEGTDSEEEAQAQIESLTGQLESAQKNNEKLRKEKEMYCSMWSATEQKNQRVTAQIKAIAVLMSSIFPED